MRNLRIQWIALIAVLLFGSVPYARGANDLDLIAGAQFQIDTIDTTETVVGDMVGTVTEISFQASFLDIEIDAGSSATFTVPTGYFLTVSHQAGSVSFGTSPTCILNQVTMTGTANSTVRIEVDTSAPPCASPSGGSQGGTLYPTSVFLEILDGACVDSSYITLRAQAVNANEIILSNFPSFQGSEWEMFAPPEDTFGWQLASGDGVRSVYAQFRNQGVYQSPIIATSTTVDSLTECGTTGPGTELETENPPTPPITVTPPQRYISLGELRFGDLIKGSLSTVYYYGPDGKRHSFPNEKTYFTWYQDFGSVRLLRDADLATIPLGANVTYRPGVRLVKVQSDPKVYALKGMMLRWVESEELARSMFGVDWAKQVDDVPDVFFTDYVLGPSIIQIGEYNASEAFNEAPSIDRVL